MFNNQIVAETPEEPKHKDLNCTQILAKSIEYLDYFKQRLEDEKNVSIPHITSIVRPNNDAIRR